MLQDAPLNDREKEIVRLVSRCGEACSRNRAMMCNAT
jgi:hypothetical protein